MFILSVFLRQVFGLLDEPLVLLGHVSGPFDEILVLWGDVSRSA